MIGSMEETVEVHLMGQAFMGITQVLLVGKGSHLARAVLAIEHDNLVIEAVSHSVDFDSLDFKRYSIVINMGYDPRYMREPYVKELDFDLHVARHVAKSTAHYVMLSTRRVYGQPMPYRISEECAPNPQDHYGHNKLHTEQQVRQLLGDRCTVLRVANVFDFELGRHTFFGIALRSLKENNQILLDVSPFVRRDFIHIEDFVYILSRVLLLRPAGLFNLGSGHGTELGRIALWVIEGYGQGNLVVLSPAERDGFELNTDKLLEAVGPIVTKTDIRTRCMEIGEKLRNE